MAERQTQDELNTLSLVPYHARKAKRQYAAERGFVCSLSFEMNIYYQNELPFNQNRSILNDVSLSMTRF